MHCFVSQNTEAEPSFRAEEFSDVSGQPRNVIILQTASSKELGLLWCLLFMWENVKDDEK